MLEAYGQNPVISVTDHDKEILKLKEEIEESRLLITLQQQCFQVRASFEPCHTRFWASLCLTPLQSQKRQGKCNLIAVGVGRSHSGH